MKAKKRPSDKRLRANLWELCKQITRKRYGFTCYTCDKSLENGSQCHTGHFIPSAVGGVYLRYDLRNLRPQCYHCNINLGGNGSMYYRKMVEREGQEYVDGIFEDKKKLTKADWVFYQMKIEEYAEILKKL